MRHYLSQISTQKRMHMRHCLVGILLGVSMIFTSQFCYSAEDQEANFTLKDMSGVKHSLAAYKGKWVFVNYWATWCPPCLEEVPDLVSLFDHHHKKDLMIIGVVFDYDSVQSVKAYMDEMHIKYPVVLGDETVTAQIGTADVMPTTFIYNPQGELVKIRRGLITKQYIEKMIGQK